MTSNFPYTLRIPATLSQPIEDLYAGALLLDRDVFEWEPSQSQSEILFSLLCCGTKPEYIGIRVFPESEVPDMIMTLHLTGEKSWDEISSDLLKDYPQCRTLDEALLAYIQTSKDFFSDYGFSIDSIEKPQTSHETMEEILVIGTPPEI